MKKTIEIILITIAILFWIFAPLLIVLLPEIKTFYKDIVLNWSDVSDIIALYFGSIPIVASAVIVWISVEEMKKQNKISSDSVKEMNEQYIQNEKNKQQEQDFQIYFQVLQPLFQRFNDTVDKYWGKDENHRSSIIPPSIPEDFDYHTMVIDVSSIYNSIKDTLLILHVPEDSFKDINEFLSNMGFIDCYTTTIFSYVTEIRDIDTQLKNYYIITVFSSPLIFDYIFQTIGLYYLGKVLPQDKKGNIEHMVNNSEKHKKDWEDRYNELRLR